jgi:serine/threonine protein kinase
MPGSVLSVTRRPFARCKESIRMATARLPWHVPGVILFSQGELSYEVDLSRGSVEGLAQSKLGERTFLAWERTAEKRTRPVIVRSVPPTSPRDPGALNRMRARLREEARLATYLQHPRIARIFGIHEVQSGLYVVSEVVEGTSLNTLISYSLMREEPFSPAFCMYVGAEVASTLYYAHTCTDEKGTPLGIVHRDVNPARIFLGPEGEIMLTDFARARSLLPGRVATTFPRPQGEVSYSSPEALLVEETDPRSDLFSLGLVLLELATGRHLYNTGNARSADLAAGSRKTAIHRRRPWRRIERQRAAPRHGGGRGLHHSAGQASLTPYLKRPPGLRPSGRSNQGSRGWHTSHSSARAAA